MASSLHRILLAMCFLGCLFHSAEALGHPLSPRLMTLTLDEGGVPVSMTWRESTTRTAGRQPEPRVPENCSRRGAGEVLATNSDAMRAVRWSLDCEASVSVNGLSVQYPPESDVIVIGRIHGPGEVLAEGILTAERPTLTIGAEQERAFPAAYFLQQGLWHLWVGLDHIAVVLGLILLLGFTRKLVFAITAFTVGHSITLSAATLGLVSVNMAFSEALIAVTVVAMALEAGHSSTGPMERHPWIVPGIIGLVHGFGFATALSGVGIERSNALVPLLSFNIGIEIGQLAIVAAGYVVFRMSRRLLRTGTFEWWLRKGSEYTLGAAGSFWLLQRMGF